MLSLQAHVAPVTRSAQVKAVRGVLLQNNKIRNATHNMMAYRQVCGFCCMRHFSVQQNFVCYTLWNKGIHKEFLVWPCKDAMQGCNARVPCKGLDARVPPFTNSQTPPAKSTLRALMDTYCDMEGMHGSISLSHEVS